MPVHMRRFYLRKLTSVKEQEANQHQKSMQGDTNRGANPPPKIDRPQFEKRK